MDREVAHWLELGLSFGAYHIELSTLDPADCPPSSDAITVVLPSMLALARMWGRCDPARAAGFASAIEPAILRAAVRAAAMEHAPWEPTAVAAALRRAEDDSLAFDWPAEADRRRVVEVWDQIAVAWARHVPTELPAVHQRLHARHQPGPSGLWAERIRELAEASQVLPPETMLPAGTPRQWRRMVRWSVTLPQRVRACLGLAVDAWSRAGSGQ